MSKPTPPEAHSRESRSSDPAHRLFIASSARSRAQAIQEWLANRSTNDPLLVLAPSRLAADDLLRDAASQRGAIFGWHRATLPQLAARIAETKLADEGLAIAGTLSIEALVTRLIHELQEEGALERFREVTDGPGFARSIARTLGELRMAGLAADATSQLDRDLSLIHQQYESALREASLADKSIVYRVAIAETLRGRSADLHHSGSQPPRWTALPTAVLDPDLSTSLDRDFLAALIDGAPASILSASKEDRHAEAIAHRCGMITTAEPISNEPGVPRLQRELFAETTADEVEPSENIRILSAPGEGRECVEIARRILALTKDGLAFDQIAVLTRSTEVYRIHIDEAFSRAGIDAWYASGSRRPHPAGRALLALLSCAAEGLSANRFSEYLSLSELPSPTKDGAPPPPDLASYVPRDDEMSRDDRRESHGIGGNEGDGAQISTDDESNEAVQETPRAPRHWERLIVDASVIGGVDRWRRRLDGLAKKLGLDRDYAEEAGEPNPARFDRDIAAIQSLSKFALPLLSDLESLPHSGTWGEWLQALERLTTRAIRRPEQILAVLAELRPLEAVGPIRIDEVQRVLSRRLLETPIPPAKSRAGMVFVGSIEAARGLSFDTVFIPGLAERMFPSRILEDPILLDRSRRTLSAELDTNRTRVENERNRMRLACSAATRRLVLSYPRLDTEHARPRVPSVYALEALRAAEGRLPGFDTLSRRAETESDARIGWPAPTNGKDAIDEAEFDLAVLKTLSGGRTSTGDRKEENAAARGAARYLIGANPHLTRALRFRARRWLNKWTPADGLVRPGEAAMKAMKNHQLSQRSFSPTALQLFSSCPYRFYLQAIWRLSPREIPEAIEEMNPLQRGSMVHDTQFELFGQLSERGLLPVTESNLEQVLTTLDQVLEGSSDSSSPDSQPTEGIRQRYKDDLAPAIERVYDDGVSSVKADLREWLRRMSIDDSGFVPWRFELSFGLRGRRDADPHSVVDPVRLDSGIQLRGSIDLVERHPDGRVRVTDHKTGRVRVKPDDRVAGGEALQTTLYPLAVEKLLTDSAVDSGRLHYCTTAGGFEDREVPLDQEARDAVQSIAEVVGKALAEPFLPAAPNDRACTYCDYKVVCGPYEQQRTRQKPRGVLGLLDAVRRMR